MTTPPTEQQLDEIETRAAARRTALSGWINCYSPLSEQETLEDAEAVLGKDVPDLVAEVRRLRDRVAELEAFAHGCDAEGCVLPHSSWCDAAKKTAAANDGCTCGRPWTGHPQPHAMHCWTVNPPRAEVEEMRKRIAELTAIPETASPDSLPAWLYQRFAVIHGCAPWDQIDDGQRAYWEHQARAVRRAVERGGFKAVAPDAASVPPGAPVRGAQPSSVSESAQSPTGAAEGAPRPSLSVGASEICGKCKKPFDLADTSRDGHNRFYLTPYCRRCVDACHDTEIADHRCVICA